MSLGSDTFEGHYVEWREKRIAACVDHYGGRDFFRGKTVLELGCGFGHIGAALVEMGADVSFTDGRPEHIAEVRKRYPTAKAGVFDADGPWFLGRYDVILHQGLLYHLRRWEGSLEDALAHCDHLILESEVCDSDDPLLVRTRGETGYDQSIHETGTHPSPAAVEAVLTKAGASFEMVTDDRCNGGGHRYDWPIRNTNGVENGQRRFWFVRSGRSAT